MSKVLFILKRREDYNATTHSHIGLSTGLYNSASFMDTMLNDRGIESVLEVAIDNNHIENLMRPWAMGRKAWLFAGSELAGQRAAMVMSLVQSARMIGHEPWAYLKDVLERLLEHPNHRIDELLPHLWAPAAA